MTADAQADCSFALLELLSVASLSADWVTCQLAQMTIPDRHRCVTMLMARSAEMSPPCRHLGNLAPAVRC